MIVDVNAGFTHASNTCSGVACKNTCCTSVVVFFGPIFAAFARSATRTLAVLFSVRAGALAFFALAFAAGFFALAFFFALVFFALVFFALVFFALVFFALVFFALVFFFADFFAAMRRTS
jgi:hypothetical protein